MVSKKHPVQKGSKKGKGFNSKLRPLYLAVASVMPVAAFGDGIIPETDKQHAPTMNQSANGTPVVNITDPNQRGISHNKYNEFNVNQQGVIFNNSMADGVSQIGGQTMKNTQLNKEANVILNEVTGAKGTHLNGTMEVFGRKADVIVANENGIKVNGVATVNTNNLTLTTGKVVPQNDGRILLNVEKGGVDIEGRGISTDGLGYFDIISRTIKLDGEIAGQAEIKAVTGLNDYDPETRTHTVRSTSGENRPEVAIDGSALGSMYGGRIQLISTESGVGVRHQGSLVGDRGVEISADGDLMLSGLKSDQGSVTLAGNNIAVQKNNGYGGIISQGDLVIRALSHLMLGADALSEQGTIRIDAGSMLQSAAALMAQNGQNSTGTIPAIIINVNDEYQIAGNLYAVDAQGNRLANAAITLEKGAYVVRVNGQVVDAAVASDAQLVAQQGDISIKAKKFKNSKGGVVARKGAITFNITDVAENDGTIQAAGSFSINAGKAKNSGIIYANDQRFTVGSLENSGALFANSTVAVETGTLDNSGVINSNADITLTANGDLLTNSGDIQGKNVTIQQNGTTAGSAKMTNTGKVQSSDALSINTDTLDNSGKIYSGKAMNLTLSDALNLHQGSETTAYGDLTVSGTEARKLNITNDGGWLQGNNIYLDGLDTLTNQNNGTIITDNRFDLKNSNALLNDSGLIQGNSVALNNINTVNNQNNSGILAGDSLSITQVTDLTNAQSTLSANNAVVMDGVQNIVNQTGLISAGNALNISNAVQLRNIDSSTIQSQGSLTIDNVGLLNNENASSMLSVNEALTLSNIGILSNDATSQIVSAAQITLADIDSLANSGLIQANAAMVLKGIHNLVNSGNTALIASIEQLTLDGIQNITNEKGAYISGETALVMTAIGKLLNSTAIIQSAGDLAIAAQSIENRGYESGILANGLLDLSAADSLINTEQALLASGELLKINTKTLSNADGGQVSGSDVEINATTLDNSLGNIQAYENLILVIGNTLKNHEGNLWSDNALELNIDNDFIFQDIADSNPDDEIDDSNNSGYINANNKLTINASGDIQIDTALESRGEIHLNAEGDLTNNYSIVSNQDIYLVGKNITNNSNALIWSMDDVSIDAREGTFINGKNGNVLSMDSMSIVAENLINDVGIIRSEGTMELDAQVLENRSEYTGGEWQYGPVQYGTAAKSYYDGATYLENRVKVWLPILSSDIKLVKAGEISSAGHMLINQKEIFTNSPEKPMSITNDGGIIQAKGSMLISGDIHNAPRYVEMSIYDYLHNPLDTPINITHIERLVSTNEMPAKFDTLYEMLDTLFGTGTPKIQNVGGGVGSLMFWNIKNGAMPGLPDEIKYRKFEPVVDALRLAADGVADSSAQLNSIMITLFGESWITKTYSDLRADWAALKKDDQKAIHDKKQYFLPSDKGSIVAGGDFVHTNGSLNNGIGDLGAKTGKDADVVVEKIGTQEVDAIDGSYDIAINLKKVEELRGGISTLPTLAELISIPGMFTTSTEWNTRNTDPDKLVKEGASSKVVPVYETRTSMIDQDAYFGSEYFFDQVGYNPTEPVTVIGDNYFISELIRRQLNQSVGTFFSVRDGVEGADLVQMLMNNASLASNDAGLGLEVGKPLTEEQRTHLDQDIVWFVNQNIDGTDVLVPMVYLSAQTMDEMEKGVQQGSGSAVIHANNGVYIDATEVNNGNGTISAGKDVIIKSKGDINNVSYGMNGGIKAGGTIAAISTDGSINNDGAAMRAGQDIILSAEKGSIDITASVGRNVEGKQEIHHFDDAISAGGSIAMQAKDITVNAGTIAAGKDILMKATEGDVAFNEMHEISAEYKYDMKGKGPLNHESWESKTTTATSEQSHVSAGGKLIVDAAHDIIMEGGEYTGKIGSFNAGNNIDIKTSQDHAYNEQKHIKKEFSITGKATGAGYTAEGSYSTLDGKSSHTDGGNYENVNDTDSASPGSRRPGKAPVAPALEVKAGFSSLKEESTAQSTTNKNAMLNFDEQLDLTAEKTLDIGGADLKTKGKMNLIAEELASTKYEDTLETTYSKEEMFIGVKNQTGSVIADVLDKNAAMVVNKVNNPETSFDPAMTALQVAGDASNLYFNDLASSTTTWGINKQSSSGSTSSASENITHIEAGQLNIQTKKDAALNGVDVKADSVNMDIGGDLMVRAAETKTSYKEKNKSLDIGISSGVAVDKDSVGMGVSLDVGVSGGKSSGDSKSYTNSTIKAKDVKIKTGGDATLDGSNIEAETASVDTGGDFNVISRQDTVNTDASSWHAGVSAGVAMTSDNGFAAPIPTFGVSAGGGSEYHDEARTNKQAGIHTTGSLDVKTQGDLNITGGNLISDSKTGTVDVAGTINARELTDTIEQDGAYGGGGAGITKTGASVNVYAETVDERHYNETQKATISVGEINGDVNGKVNQDASELSKVNKDEKEWGNDISFTIAGGKGGSSKKKPDTVKPTKPDTVRPAPKPDDVRPAPKPDDARPQPTPKPDDAQPKPTPKPDDAQPKPTPKPDDAQPQPEPTPDYNPPKPDDLKPKPDDNQPKPDDTQPKPDDTQPKPDDTQPKPDGTDGNETIDPVKPQRPGEYNGKHWEVQMPERVILTPGSATGKTEWIEPPRNGNTNNGTPYEGVPRSGSTLPRGAETKKADTATPADPSKYEGKQWGVTMPDPVVLTPGSSTNNIKDHDTPRNGNNNNGTPYEGQGKIIHDPNGTAKNISETTGLNGDPSQYDGKKWDVNTPDPVVLTPGSNTNNIKDHDTPRNGNTDNGTPYEGQGKIVHDPSGTAKNIAETTGLNGDPSQYDGKKWDVNTPDPVVLTPGSNTNNVKDHETPRNGNNDNGTPYEGQGKIVHDPSGTAKNIAETTGLNGDPSQYDGKKWDVNTPDPVVLTPGSNTNNVKDHETPRDGNINNGTEYKAPGNLVKGSVRKATQTTATEPAAAVQAPGSTMDGAQAESTTSAQGNLLKGSVRKATQTTATEPAAAVQAPGAKMDGAQAESTTSAQGNLLKGSVRKTTQSAEANVAPGENGGGVQKPVAEVEVQGKGITIQGLDEATKPVSFNMAAPKAKVAPGENGGGVQKPVAGVEVKGKGITIQGLDEATKPVSFNMAEPKASVAPGENGGGVQKPVAGVEVKGKGITIQDMDKATKPVSFNMAEPKAKVAPGENGGGVQKPVAGVEVKGKGITIQDMDKATKPVSFNMAESDTKATGKSMTGVQVKDTDWKPLLPEYQMSAKQTYQDAEWSQASTFGNNNKGKIN